MDSINSALNTSTTTSTAATSSGRARRQSESTTVSPVNGCSDFSLKYKQLLDELSSFADSNVGLIKQLVTVLNNSVESIPCDEAEKNKLKSETENNVAAAKSKAYEYKAQKEKEMDDLIKVVLEALTVIDEANQDLINENKPTLAMQEPEFTVPTEQTNFTTASSSSPTNNPTSTSGITETSGSSSSISSPTSTSGTQETSSSPSSTSSPTSTSVTQETSSSPSSTTSPTSTSVTQETISSSSSTNTPT